ncbi:MAG: TraR/DksA C4-type zinc finger protein [Opitutales bacterium]
MDVERLAFFRELLESKAKEIEAYLETSKDSAGVVELDTSIGRLSRMDAIQSQQMALELRRRKEAELSSIRNALQRIEKGSYGTCILCRQPIAEGRLEVLPDVMTCVNCA